MMNTNKGPVVLAMTFAALLLCAAPAEAQTSTSYRLEESTLNMGGRPSEGLTASSASFQISLDSLGDPFTAMGMMSASFSMDGGLLPAFGPPGEVLQLMFLDKDTLDWLANPNADVYHLYSNALSALAGGDAGACSQPGLLASTAVDNNTPGAGEAWFYLVTAENRLGEEGTRGASGAGAERPQTDVCP